MERAFFANSIGELESFPRDASRLYFGAEFCGRLLPSPKELAQAVDFCKSAGRPFTFATPILTESKIPVLRKLLQQLSSDIPDAEVVVNDWGVLRLLEGFEFRPVLGRILNRQHRDPRIVSLSKKVPKTLTEHYTKSHADSPGFRDFLSSFGISRVELDNLLQGLATDLSGTGVRGTLHIPYGFVSATRICLAINCESISARDRIGIMPCSKDCLDYEFSLSDEFFKQPLVLRGNTLHFFNEKIPEVLEEKGIDRVVSALSPVH